MNNTYQVSIEWLAAHREQDNLIIFDATMVDPYAKDQQLATESILGARRFDFSGDVVDKESDIGNMMPSASDFTQAVQRLGVNQDSEIVVYDQQGLFSAARAWYMFRAMGHQQVKILQGGLPQWRVAHLPMQADYPSDIAVGNFIAHPQENFFVDKKTVLDAINQPDSQLVDARGYARFSGQESEPRANMRSGHIPNSLNLHYAKLVQDGQLLDEATLNNIFTQLTPMPERFIFSCGSGVTACILALAAHIVGHQNISVYDGSWSEWGQDNLLPIDVIDTKQQLSDL